MIRICAWCKKELDRNVCPELEKFPITHGICCKCAYETMQGAGTPLAKFLDQFEKPVFVLSAQARVICANKSGADLIGKKPEMFINSLGGEAFGCKHAAKPEGCGGTVHCRSCAMRRAVMETFATGESREKVAAYPDLHHLTGDNRIKFLISTEKTGDAVLMRIDEIENFVESPN
ncbi:MAG: hypothetical protein ACOYXC_06605 [Candidatus Rifleibacteriota bacterium]